MSGVGLWHDNGSCELEYHDALLLACQQHRMAVYLNSKNDIQKVAPHILSIHISPCSTSFRPLPFGLKFFSWQPPQKKWVSEAAGTYAMLNSMPELCPVELKCLHFVRQSWGGNWEKLQRLEMASTGHKLAVCGKDIIWATQREGLGQECRGK